MKIWKSGSFWGPIAASLIAVMGAWLLVEIPVVEFEANLADTRHERQLRDDATRELLDLAHRVLERADDVQALTFSPIFSELETYPEEDRVSLMAQRNQLVDDFNGARFEWRVRSAVLKSTFLVELRPESQPLRYDPVLVGNFDSLDGKLRAYAECVSTRYSSSTKSMCEGRRATEVALEFLVEELNRRRP